MLHNSVHFKNADYVVSSEFTLKVELLDRVKSVPGRVHGNKNGELRSLIKTIDCRWGQYPVKVGRGGMRGDHIR
jgi:hypothetical protein